MIKTKRGSEAPRRIWETDHMATCPLMRVPAPLVTWDSRVTYTQHNPQQLEVCTLQISKGGKNRQGQRKLKAQRGAEWIWWVEGSSEPETDEGPCHGKARIRPLMCFRKTIVSGQEATQSRPLMAAVVINPHLRQGTNSPPRAVTWLFTRLGPPLWWEEVRPRPCLPQTPVLQTLTSPLVNLSHPQHQSWVGTT